MNEIQEKVIEINKYFTIQQSAIQPKFIGVSEQILRDQILALETVLSNYH